MKRSLRAATVAAVLTAVCAVAASAASAYTLPPVNGQFDYQIGGPYTPASSVQIVDRDRTVAPVAGKYNVCYVNAFQAQPDDTAWWRANHDNLLLKNATGRYVIDSSWGEVLLDTRTAANRTELAGIIGGWFDRCAADGFQAIEPDNLDSWTRSKRLITKANNIAMATLLASRAHAADLAIAQKNTSEIASQGVSQIGFDFVIAEECQLYTGNFGQECDDFLHYYGNQVYEIEYSDNGVSYYNAACTARGASISVIYRDRQVTPFGDPAYIYRSC